MNAARDRWLDYGRRLAAVQPDREAAAAAAGTTAPTPRQVRAEVIAGCQAGANARRWLAQGWRQHPA